MNFAKTLALSGIILVLLAICLVILITWTTQAATPTQLQSLQRDLNILYGIMILGGVLGGSGALGLLREKM